MELITGVLLTVAIFLLGHFLEGPPQREHPQGSDATFCEVGLLLGVPALLMLLFMFY